MINKIVGPRYPIDSGTAEDLGKGMTAKIV